MRAAPPASRRTAAKPPAGSSPCAGSVRRRSRRRSSAPSVSVPRLEAVSSHEQAQDRSALAVVVALSRGSGRGPGVLQAIRDNRVAFLELVRVLGVIPAVLVEQPAQP